MKVITFITLGIVIMTRIINKRGSKYRRNDYLIKITLGESPCPFNYLDSPSLEGFGVT